MSAFTKVHARRMLKTATRVHGVQRKKFNINHWRFVKPECGAVACAIGYAATVPCLRRAGLKLKLNVKDKDGTSYKPVFVPNGAAEVARVEAVCRETGLEPTVVFEQFQAAEAAFGLTKFQANDLFSHHGYGSYTPTPKQVARKLRAFVKERHPDVYAADLRERRLATAA